ncbi:MAG: hypothetical protein DRP83_08530, partial [Planctomycetota bacterium]
RVIKSNMVTDGGVQQLSYKSPSATGKSKATAKIVGQKEGCVIVQVQCDCGREIQLKCTQPE